MSMSLFTYLRDQRPIKKANKCSLCALNIACYTNAGKYSPIKSNESCCKARVLACRKSLASGHVSGNYKNIQITFDRTSSVQKCISLLRGRLTNTNHIWRRVEKILWNEWICNLVRVIVLKFIFFNVNIECLGLAVADIKFLSFLISARA
jgi:hypothetical protein